jgi:hypothetical protein
MYAPIRVTPAVKLRAVAAAICIVGAGCRLRTTSTFPFLTLMSLDETHQRDVSIHAREYRRLDLPKELRNACSKRSSSEGRPDQVTGKRVSTAIAKLFAYDRRFEPMLRVLAGDCSSTSCARRAAGAPHRHLATAVDSAGVPIPPTETTVSTLTRPTGPFDGCVPTASPTTSTRRSDDHQRERIRQGSVVRRI